MMTLAKLARGGLLFLSGFGFIAGARLSITHLQHGEICPMIGPVPACIIVFMGYFMVFVAALMIDKNWSRRIFYMGWTPVFLLALMGVIFELTRGQICPPGPAGIPQCFISLAMAGLCWLLFRRARRKSAT